jgi:hypothetical protein
MMLIKPSFFTIVRTDKFVKEAYSYIPSALHHTKAIYDLEKVNTPKTNTPTLKP